MAESIEISGRKLEFAEDEYTGTVAEAVAAFRRDYPGFTIDTIDGEDVIHWCEVCGCPLFEDSDYYESEDGVTWCKSHDAPEEPAE